MCRKSGIGQAGQPLHTNSHHPSTRVLRLSTTYQCRCRVDMVLVGAEGVVENGGVINKLGTYQLSLCAHAHGIPFYVAAESYKVGLQCTSPGYVLLFQPQH